MRKNQTTYLLFTLILLSTAGCEHGGRRPANIYIPDGYVGWVRIEYGVEGTAALERDFFGPWEYQRFPPSGLLQTSSELQHGAASANYFYYSARGEQQLTTKMIHGGVITWCVARPDGERLERDFMTFFVGPKEEYEKHKQELEQFSKGDCKYVVNSLEDLPKPGNLRERQ